MSRQAPSKSAPKKSEQRRFARRAKSIRFAFDQNGEEHFAVTTIVGLGGAFVKSSAVPRPGALLVLRERFNAAAVDISVRCEVVWTIERPTLERPDIGFGFRIHEIATQADPGHLEDFLRALDPGYKTIPGAGIAYEERTSGAHAIFRVPAIAARGEFFSDEDLSPADLDDLIEVDLASELARLDGGPALSSPTVTDSRPERGAGFNSRKTVPHGMNAYRDPGTYEGDAPEGSGAAKRAGRRSVTGIFTALFGRPKLSERDPADVFAAPNPGDAGAGSVTREARRPAMVLSWGATTLVARIDQLTPQLAALWTTDSAPEPGTPIVLRPAGALAPLDALAIHAHVLERSARPRGGGHRIVVRIARVDEQGQVGRFGDYLRFIASELVGR
jgi:hypothetical protein